MKSFWMSKDKKLGGIYRNYSHIANDQHILTNTTLPHRRRKQIMVWESYISYFLQREYVLSAWSSRQKLGLIKGACSIPWGHVGFHSAAINLWATGWDVGLGVKLQDWFCVIRGRNTQAPLCTCLISRRSGGLLTGSLCKGALRWQRMEVRNCDGGGCNLSLPASL